MCTVLTRCCARPLKFTFIFISIMIVRGVYDQQYIYKEALFVIMHTSSLLREMWPLLVTMRMLGWLPIQRDNDNDVLHLEKRVIIYSCFVLTLEFVPALYFFINGFKAVSSFESDIKMRSYVQLLVALLLPRFISIFAMLQSSFHVKLLNDFFKFQIDIERISLSGHSLSFGLRKYSIITVFLSANTCFLVMVLMPIVRGVFPAFKLDLYVTLTMSHFYSIMGWWFAIMKAIQVCSRHLVIEFQKLSEYNESGKTGDLVGQVTLGMRNSWLHLYKLLRSSGNTLSLSLSIFLINISLIILYNTFELLGPQYLSSAIFIFISTSLTFCFLYFICDLAYHAKQQVYTDTIIALQITKKLKISNVNKEQMTTFLLQMLQIVPNVSMRSYLVIDRGLVSVVISTLITNVLVIYQLKIPDGRPLEIYEFFIFGNGTAM